MSEPYLPVPDPEPNDYWDPLPYRCPECREIIGVHPGAHGRWEGWCQCHGTVVPVRANAISDSEMTSEEES